MRGVGVANEGLSISIWRILAGKLPIYILPGTLSDWHAGRQAR